MSFQVDLPRHIRGIEFFSLTSALKNFREEMERGTGSQVQAVEVNAALLIDDIAKFLGLGEKQREEILGSSASAFVSSFQDEPIKLDVKH